MTVNIPVRLTKDWLSAAYVSELTTPREVIEEIVRRAERDAGKHVWITGPSMAIAEPYLARLAELDPAASPLWGIPFAIKDNIDLAGVPTTAGCEAYAYTPTEHAAVVQRLIDAGAVPIGKTNLDQFATGLVGTRSPYGETHNALKEELISGGSSSGSAVAVTLGHAAFALGTDTAGSGRVPAALNGLVGYKPSLGAWPTTGVVPACASLDCVTVFTHSLGDALTVDAAVRGADPRDPWSRVLPKPAPALPRHVYVPQSLPEFYGAYADGYAAAWEAALVQAQRLFGEDVRLVPLDTQLFEQAAALLYDGPWVAERWASLGRFVETHQEQVHPVTAKVLRTGASDQLTAVSVFQAMHRLQRYKREAAALLHDAVLMLPTVGGTYSREQVRQDPIGTNSRMGRYTNHCNLLDLCAIAIPAGEAAPDVPFGLTLFSLADQEGLIQGAANRLLQGEAEHALAVETVQADEETTLIAVCGLHMRGYPLEIQMLASGASFVEEVSSAPMYRFVKLPTVPAKPGMIKLAKGEEGGGSIRLELWAMPLRSFGSFAASIPAPLGIGKVELADGREVPGFICEAYAAHYPGAEDITSAGSWRSVAPAGLTSV